MNPSRNWSQDSESVYPTPDSSVFVDLDGSTCKRLINGPHSQPQVIKLLGDIFTSEHEVKMIGYLRGDDAQAFIDALDQALGFPNLPQRLRKMCLSASCKICGRQALLPRSLHMPLCYDRSGTPLYRGGFADVWKGEYQGRHVAVKVLRVYSTSDFDKIISRFCKEVVTWKALRHPNVLPLLGVTMDTHLFAMASEWMNNGNINEFIRAHRNANRFELFTDVARGLIYMHDQAMIHGDLKGANILINHDGHAQLADFGLLTIVSDPTNPTASSSSVKGGTTRWMSPELLDPEQFGFKDSKPTRESDCYALGMVVYEVLSGQVPFAPLKDFIVMRKVLEGDRPGIPEGPERVWFTGELWRMLNTCWDTQPGNRPSIATVQKFLERASRTWKPPAPEVDEDLEMDVDDWDLTTVSDSSEVMPLDPQPPLTDPPEEDPPKGVIVMKTLPTRPPSYSVERSEEIILYDESVPYITTPPIPDTPVEFISVELTVLAPRAAVRFELSLNAPTSLRLPRGAGPVRGLEKWRGELEITVRTPQKTRDEGGMRLIGVHGKVGSDEPCVLARTGDSLTVWAVPDEVVGGVGEVSVQSAKVLYGML